MKLAVIIATYCRPNGKSPEYLRRVFSNLCAQTNHNFKVFIVGDCYSKPEEFITICQEYEKTGAAITYVNQEKHFRVGLKRPENRWKCGGSNARSMGIRMAVDEGYEYYLHLDDDDIWRPDHIQTYIDALESNPGIDFMISVSLYRYNFHSPGNVKTAELNNYRPSPGGGSHSTWCVNLKTLGPWLLDKYDHFIKHVVSIIEKNKTNPNCHEPALMAFDAHIMQCLGELYDKKAITTLCLPTITVEIESDGNHPDQVV